jgi:hypothetical protein
MIFSRLTGFSFGILLQVSCSRFGLYPRHNRRVPHISLFFARCGIPQVFPSSLPRVPQLTRVPYVRTSVRGPKTLGEALRQPFAADSIHCHLERR